MLRGAIPFTGLLTHCYDFLISPSCDTFIPNKHFNPETVDPITIFCVHGTADRSWAFFRLANAMLPDLPAHIRGFYLASFDGRLEGLSIKAYAEQLRGKINGFQDKHVILMGHSRGALVCAWYAEFLAEKDHIQIDTVSAICGPFKGSRKALKLFAWMSQSVEEMREDSQFLSELRGAIFASPIRYLYVGALQDIIVEDTSWHPYEGVPPEGHFLECRDDAHLSITSSEELAAWLREMLQHRQEQTKTNTTAPTRR